MSFGGIRASAISAATTPANGGNEVTYLGKFLDKRRAAMINGSWDNTDRIDTEQRAFLNAGNLGLNVPLNWSVYGDNYSITVAP